MSTGITIVSASYGSGSSTVDVTSTVTSHIKDGELNLLVSTSSLNVTDPAPGQPKQLTVSYTINSGSKNSKTITEGNTLHIIAPGQKTADGLVITKAEYGYTSNYTDVTDAIQSYVSNGSIDLTVGPSTVGIPDPNPSKKKSLKVTYTLNGSSNTETIDDGKKFTLSAPPLDAPSTKSPRQKALTGLGIVGVNFGYFVMTFGFLLNLIACCRISLDWFKTITFGFFIGMLPLSYLWGILPILFIRRMIFSENALTANVMKPIGGWLLQYVDSIPQAAVAAVESVAK